MSVMDHAKQKAGPLPVYGWVLIIGGGIALLLWHHNRKANAAASAPTSNSAGTGVSQSQYAAGEIAADYSLENQLALNRGTETTLASNVGKETTAEEANTQATKGDTKADKEDVKSDRHKPARRGRGNWHHDPDWGWGPDNPRQRMHGPYEHHRPKRRPTDKGKVTNG